MMNKILVILLVLTIIGLLGVTGIAFNEISSSEVSHGWLVFSGISLVSADDCEPPPGYPDNCDE